MFQNYLLDVSKESRSFIHTPSLIAQQLPFCVHNCGHYYAGREYFTEREGQDNYLIIYTISGNGTLKYKDAEYRIGPGQITFTNCNEYHYYKTGRDGAWEIKWVHLNGAQCGNYYDLINEDSLFVTNLMHPKETERHFDVILETIHQNDIVKDAKHSMLLTNILTDIITSKLNPVNNRKHSEHTLLVSKAIHYIQENYREKLNIRDILETIHVSEYHFLRMFKRYTGTGLYEYLINYRINKSKTLLKETAMSVNEIAGCVGFNNINNYIRDFKKLVGTTPLKYKNFWIN